MAHVTWDFQIFQVYNHEELAIIGLTIGNLDTSLSLQSADRAAAWAADCLLDFRV